MYGWVKTLCLTRFCHQTQKKNHVSAKKWIWWQSPLGLDEDSNERKTLPAGWELSCIMEKHFRFLNEKNDFGSRLSLSHGVCYRCVELHLKLEENMLFWFYEFIRRQVPVDMPDMYALSKHYIMLYAMLRGFKNQWIHL